MHRVSCSVHSCSYNQEGICGANVLKVGGDRAMITERTYCETFIDKDGYHNALGQRVTPGETESILCDVSTCAYHAKYHCTLKEIEVGSLKDVENYSETDCLSFERR